MGSHQLILRDAVPSDLEILKFWDEQQHVIDSDPNDDWNWEIELNRKPTWRNQFVAEINHEPIGFVQIIDPALEETHYWGNCGTGKRAIDIWIGEEKNLSKGYGTQMMRLALQICFQNKEVNEVLIDPLASNKRAIQFYQRLGFRFLEYRNFNEDYCAVHVISREDFL